MSTTIPMNAGWMCPQCGKAHGPHVDTCPAQNMRVNPPLPYAQPIPPNTTTPPWVTTTGGIASVTDRTLTVWL